MYTVVAATTPPNVIGAHGHVQHVADGTLDRLKSKYKQSCRRAKRVSAASLIREAVDQYLEKADDRR